MRMESLTKEDPSTVIGHRFSPTRPVSIRLILGHGAIRIFFMDSGQVDSSAGFVVFFKFTCGECSTKYTHFSAISHSTAIPHGRPA